MTTPGQSFIQRAETILQELQAAGRPIQLAQSFLAHAPTQTAPVYIAASILEIYGGDRKLDRLEKFWLGEVFHWSEFRSFDFEV